RTPANDCRKQHAKKPNPCHSSGIRPFRQASMRHSVRRTFFVLSKFCRCKFLPLKATHKILDARMLCGWISPTANPPPAQAASSHLLFAFEFSDLCPPFSNFQNCLPRPPLLISYFGKSPREFQEDSWPPQLPPQPTKISLAANGSRLRAGRESRIAIPPTPTTWWEFSPPRPKPTSTAPSKPRKTPSMPGVSLPRPSAPKFFIAPRKFSSNAKKISRAT